MGTGESQKKNEKLPLCNALGRPILEKHRHKQNDCCEWWIFHIYLVYHRVQIKTIGGPTNQFGVLFVSVSKIGKFDGFMGFTSSTNQK